MSRTVRLGAPLRRLQAFVLALSLVASGLFAAHHAIEHVGRDAAHACDDVPSGHVAHLHEAEDHHEECPLCQARLAPSAALPSAVALVVDIPAPTERPLSRSQARGLDASCRHAPRGPPQA